VPPAAERRGALGVAAMAALLAVALTYAVTRVAQAALYPEPDPALVVWSTRIGMYWRLAIGAYAGAMVAPLAHAWARRDLAAATAALPALVGATIAVMALQSAVFP
jgi:hypothetical protein